MTSDRRMEANRENASKSTGPTTEAGKRRVSQNARRHGLSTPPEAETIQGWLSTILEDPALEGHVLSYEGQAVAASLADAEARLQRVRDTEFRFLEDCHVLDRSAAHLEHRLELVTTTFRIYNSTKLDADGVPRTVKARTKPKVIKRREKVTVTNYADELRRLLRYRREAECRRRHALKDWTGYLKRLQKSKTKPREVAHVG